MPVDRLDLARQHLGHAVSALTDPGRLSTVRLARAAYHLAVLGSYLRGGLDGLSPALVRAALVDANDALAGLTDHDWHALNLDDDWPLRVARVAALLAEVDARLAPPPDPPRRPEPLL